MNPDGVDSGHWRHNANGVDLNRDWGQFNQPETRIARDEFLRLEKKSRGKIRFGMDFHSTQHDVFYPFYDSRPDNAALLDAWLKGVETCVPEYKTNVEPSRNRNDAVTLVSVAWMNHQFGIPTVTYEVGDETDRVLIEKVARAAANSLMELLLDAKK
jgi:cytosolic carboxypeptidase protein 6